MYLALCSIPVPENAGQDGSAFSLCKVDEGWILRDASMTANATDMATTAP